jgi:hypothetical protein
MTQFSNMMKPLSKCLTMTDQHHVTPPSELVEKWYQEAPDDDEMGLAQHIATRAARWAADQELEACVEWLIMSPVRTEEYLRATRRPNPPVTAEQALETLRLIPIDPENGIGPSGLDTIRAALERLQQLEQLP